MYKNDGKRPLSTPGKTPRKVKGIRPGTPPRRVLVFKSTQKVQKVKKSVGYASRCIEHYEYKKAFSYLYNNFAGARRAVTDLISNQIRKGMKSIAKDKSLALHQECSFESFQNFKWTNVIKDIQKHVPLLNAAITSAVTTKDNQRTLLSPRGKPLMPGICLVASILAHLRSPHNIRHVQGLLSVELWRCGARRKLFKHFNALGLCSSRDTAIRLLSKIRTHADDELLKIKADIEYQIQHGFEQPDSSSESDSETDEDVSNEVDEEQIDSDNSSETTDSENSSSDDDSSSQSSDEFTVMIPEEKKSKGFCLVWDNVSKMVKATHQSMQRQNKMMLWALSYSMENRIPTVHLDQDTVIKAKDIQLQKFLPMASDMAEIRHRMETIVKRIIVQGIPFLNEFEVHTNKHIRHAFWRESSKKSSVINLGVCQEDPSTIAGTIKILEHLQQYVPQHQGRVFPVICYGDGLSCERHNDAHMARSNGQTEQDRLQGMQPIAQEFHKRMILMQDLMNVFFSGNSATEKGTLFYLKNVFGHRAVKKDIGDSFNHAAEFIKFVTHGYTILAAMHASGMNRLDDIPVHARDLNQKQQHKYLDDIACKVVSIIWQDANTDDIINPPEIDQLFDLCHCKEDLGLLEDDAHMIECSGYNCPGNNWFHLECLGLSVEDVPDGDFFCSDECRKRKAYKYCCNIDLGRLEPMIGCDNEQCPRGEWFHMKCVGITSAPTANWYCSTACQHEARQRQPAMQDHKANYVKALLFQGLMDLVRRDAIRENDGEAMMSHWRFDMLSFHNRYHPKYVILSHRLLAGIAGWLPERLRMDSMWNRTVNLAGGPGRNLEADIVNEFLNKEFKESLKDAGGNLTDETISRHGQMVGRLDRVFDTIFAEARDVDAKSFIKKGDINMADDLKHFVQLLSSEHFFDNTEGREFTTFPSFQFSIKSKNPKGLHDKLWQLSKRLDKIRRCTKSFSQS